MGSQQWALRDEGTGTEAGCVHRQGPYRRCDLSLEDAVNQRPVGMELRTPSLSGGTSGR